ncbi:FemAB family PEP-CTERM system-associated protein [soil metagenome]
MGLDPSLPAIRVEVTSDLAAWDAFVESHEDSTFCHQSGWRNLMKETLGHDTSLLVASEAHRIRAVLPLVRVKSPLGHYLLSVPFMNDGGPIGDDGAKSALIDHAIAEAKRSGVRLLELRSRMALDGPVTVSYRKVAVHLELPSTVGELWEKTFKAKLRSQIRRPTKEGMTVRWGQGELDAFYRVFSRNMRDLGTPVLPREFFERLSAEFGERVLFFAVYSVDAKPVAASCCLFWRDEVEVTWASSLREFNHLSPNMLLYATMMEQAIARGVRTFNFGRSSPGAATHKFKLQWGGHDVPLPWASWSPRADAGTPSADSAAYGLAIRVWQRLPMPIANRLGPMISRALP